MSRGDQAVGGRKTESSDFALEGADDRLETIEECAAAAEPVAPDPPVS